METKKNNATAKKAVKKPVKQPTKRPILEDDIRTDTDALICVCEGCLRGLKAGKENAKQRWFLTKAAEVIRWADAHGYPNTENWAHNAFIADANHMGEITVRQLMEVVSNTREYPKGLDTVIRIGDVEGNNAVNGDVCLTFHRKGDVVLSIDPNEGDRHYY